MRLHIHPLEGSGDGLCGFDQETKESITVTHAEIIYQRRTAVLVLAAAVDSEGPGPLVSSLGRIAGNFPIPVAIVPGHLTDEELDAMS